MIKAFADVSTSCVMVSTKDKFDIRTGRSQIDRMKIDINKVAWLLNIAEDTKLDDKSRQFISPAKMKIMQFIDYFYGKRETFCTDSSSRKNFSVFLNEMVLRRLR